MEKETKKRQRCEVYSRVCGYLSPTRLWNVGKVEEMKLRKEYDIDKTLNHKK